MDTNENFTLFRLGHGQDVSKLCLWTYAKDISSARISSKSLQSDYTFTRQENMTSKWTYYFRNKRSLSSRQYFTKVIKFDKNNPNFYVSFI